jgi:ComF family protein
LIHLFKYDGMQPLAEPLGRMLASALPRDQAFDAIVPMPLHWRRRWSRGFNQSALLAQFLSKRLDAPVVNALTRRKATQPQAGLTNAQRRDNVAHAFRAARGRSVKDLRVLLVDDVLTTGATVSAAAHVLKRGGARRVTVLTVARADRRQMSILSDQRQGSPKNGQSGPIA